MAMEIIVHDLELEITRRCNATCKHCMRGEAQNIDMTPHIIQNIFENKNHKITYIYDLLLTGGEPLLNKEGLCYLLEYILNHNISVDNIFCITNGLIYNEDIIYLLTELQKRNTCIQFQIQKDQFHPTIPPKNLESFLFIDFYNYSERYLKKQDIIDLGRAKENHLGAPTSAKIAETTMAKIKDHLIIVNSNIKEISLESLYVTADGRFGSAPCDATWDMIDEKYKLDIRKDSLFTNCELDLTFKIYIAHKEHKELILPTNQFINDYNQAKAYGNLDLFFHELNENKIREYLTNSNGISRRLHK